MKDQEKIEKTFREKLEDYKVPVAASAWAGIEGAIGQGASTVATSVSTMFYAAAVVLSVVFTTTIISYNTDRDNNKQELALIPDVEETNNPEETQNISFVEEEEETETAKIEEKETITTAAKNSTKSNYVVKEVHKNAKKTESTVKVEKVEESKLFAFASASVSGGYAPLRVSFSHMSSEGTKVLWNFGDKTQSTSNNPTHTFVYPGVYTVTLIVTDSKGNKSTDIKTIEVKEGSSITNISPIITPNGDGFMDEFTFTTKNITEFNLTIYTKAGKEVFESKDINTTWKGLSSNGKKLPEDSYLYLINAKGLDGKEYQLSGQVTLLTRYRQ
jgi:gliding motility-associated-like protein